MKKKWFKDIWKYLVSVALIAFILSRIDLHVLLEQSKEVSFTALGLSLVMMVCQILFLSMRWHALMNAGRVKVSFATATLINVAGSLANILFITSVGGIVAKSALAIRYGLSFSQALLATFLDRFMTLFSLVVFSLISLPFLFNILDHKLIVMLAFAVISVVAVCVGFVFVLRSGILNKYIMGSRKKARILAVFRTYAENMRLMRDVCFYSIVAQGCFFVGVYVLSVGLHSDAFDVFHVVSFMALLPVLALIASLPISFGGWGVREGAFIYGLGLIGYSWEAAFFISVQVGVVTMIAPLVVGLPYLMRYDVREFLKGRASLKGHDVVS